MSHHTKLVNGERVLVSENEMEAHLAGVDKTGTTAFEADCKVPIIKAIITEIASWSRRPYEVVKESIKDRYEGDK